MNKRIAVNRLCPVVLSFALILLFVVHIFPTQSMAYDTLVYGIDVSAYQGEIEWSKVKSSGVDFAIIRSGLGKYAFQEDVKFKSNYVNAKKSGIECGTYWVSYAMSIEEAYEEASVCYEVIKDCEFEYPVFYDMEVASQCEKLSKSQITKIALAFCEKMKSYGFSSGIYANLNWFTNYINKSEIIANGYEIWLAQYPSGDYAVDPKKFDKSSSCSIWQYSSKGKVNGITGNVDVDVSYVYYRPNNVTTTENTSNHSTSDKTIIYYPTCSSEYTSFVDALKSINVDSSKENRKRIAELNSINDYNYTAEQNTELLNKLKAGILIKEIVYTQQTTQLSSAVTEQPVVSSTITHFTTLPSVTAGQIITTTKIFVTESPAIVVNMIYDANGGTCRADAKKVYYGERVGSLILPNKENSEFLGWFTKNGECITEETIVQSKTDFTVYAKWKENEMLYGDITNDDILNIQDAVILEKYFHGVCELTASQYNAADINSDGLVNILDMVLLKNILILN